MFVSTVMIIVFSQFSFTMLSIDLTNTPGLLMFRKVYCPLSLDFSGLSQTLRESVKKCIQYQIFIQYMQHIVNKGLPNMLEKNTCNRKTKQCANKSQSDLQNWTHSMKMINCWVQKNHALCIVLKMGFDFLLTVHCSSYYKFVYKNIDIFSFLV